MLFFLQFIWCPSPFPEIIILFWCHSQIKQNQSHLLVGHWLRLQSKKVGNSGDNVGNMQLGNRNIWQLWQRALMQYGNYGKEQYGNMKKGNRAIWQKTCKQQYGNMTMCRGEWPDCSAATSCPLPRMSSIPPITKTSPYCKYIKYYKYMNITP